MGNEVRVGHKFIFMQRVKAIRASRGRDIVLLRKRGGTIRGVLVDIDEEGNMLVEDGEDPENQRKLGLIWVRGSTVKSIRGPTCQ